MTVNGKLELSRYSLKPADPQSKKRLLETDGLKRVVPLDIRLGIEKLPFKMTVGAMLTTAYWAQNQMSYRRASEYGAPDDPFAPKGMTHFGRSR